MAQIISPHASLILIFILILSYQAVAEFVSLHELPADGQNIDFW
ncbi:MAG TPA: hypothetical protein VNF04_15970 [Stellaceae bacterium]|nr:hypothetical protein [Stellaceae bacterium]